jgi:AmiR/NasT family two-component response regulator
MDFFNLPSRTNVGRVVPKNAFDKYTNTRQKKLFSDGIQRITWTHKLSTETVNLDAKDIKEIQVFKIDLKERSNILKILELINQAIPYCIVFWVEFKDQAYISTAAKHPHPTNEDVSVVDWAFTSDWFKTATTPYHFNLRTSLDAVFKDLCVQLTRRPGLFKKSMAFILQNQQEIDQLKNELAKLKSAISRSMQFNEKVDLNLKLKEVETKLNKYENTD